MLDVDLDDCEEDDVEETLDEAELLALPDDEIDRLELPDADDDELKEHVILDEDVKLIV